jgi:uncharacterized protein (UPF0332 family)
MSCTPQDLLNFAEKLSNSSEEVELRSSISRAYYAAFHTADAAKSICPEIHRDTVAGGSHKYVIKRYLDIASPTLARQIGYILQDMCTRRESADYTLSDNCTTNHAKTQIVTAKKLILLIDQLKAESSGHTSCA